MKTTLLFILTLLRLITLETNADEGRTKEGQMIFGIGQAIDVYKLVHEGRLPKSWDEISELTNLREKNEGMMRRYGYKLEDRYEFVTKPMPVYGEPETQVLLIRTLPLKDRKPMLDGSYQLYRYIVYQYPSGNISGSWIPEEIVQKTLKNASLTVTPKPGLPEFEYDKHSLDYVPAADGIDRPDPIVPPKDATSSSEGSTSPVSPLKTTLAAKNVSIFTATESRGWLAYFLVIPLALWIIWRLLRKPAK